VIQVQNVTKYYGDCLAVDDISFHVGKGEIVGFLGPNAAGKTTTMRLITGYLFPTKGDVWIADYNMRTHALEARRFIGYLPEMVPLYTDMTIRTYLKYMARLRGVDRRRCKILIEKVVEQCNLQKYIDVIIGKLSKGFRQRVGLAQAIIHDPEVLILDEPTIGIDPIQVAQTRKLICQLGYQRTILLSTHILSEVSMICKRVIIIHNGKIVAQDRIQNLSTILRGNNRIRLKVQGPAERVADRLKQIDGIISVSYEDPFHVVDFLSDQEPYSQIMTAMIKNGWTLLTLESVDISLEDIFLQFTAKPEAKS